MYMCKFSFYRGHKELVFDHTELQSTHADARMRVSDLSERLLVQSTVAEQLKASLELVHVWLYMYSQGRIKRERASNSLRAKTKGGGGKVLYINLFV